MNRLSLASSVAILSVLACSCGTQAAPVRPQIDGRNLVLITADTLRADHLQTYGYYRDAAPRIDALARESLVFDHCYAPIARTTPSHLSLMTGVYPYEHGVATNFGHLSERDKLDQAFVSKGGLASFAQWVSGQLDTAGFVGAAPVKRITGLANGFETWDEPRRDRRPGKLTNRAVIAWLEQQTEPFFLWVHYMDAHGTYGKGKYPPEGYIDLFETDEGMISFLRERAFPELIDGLTMKNVSPAVITNYYDGAIRVLDEAVGELLDALKANGHWDDSVLVFMSDHGQGLGQHGYAGHGDVWNEQLQVPLFIRAPGLTPGRADQLMSTIDVLPTAMAMGRLFDAPGFLQQAKGRDALGAGIEGKPVFGMGGRQVGSYSLTVGDWKYIHRPGAQDALYAVASDRFELRDVLGENPEVGRTLCEQLLAEIEAQKLANEAYGAGGSHQTLDPVHLEQLRALGYTGEQ